jgi:hypothetical protein
MQISTDPAILRAALIGYQQQLDYVNSQIDQLRRKLAGAPAVPMLGETVAQPRKHHVSPEGRARIAAAQRRRWAATRRAARAGR